MMIKLICNVRSEDGIPSEKLRNRPKSTTSKECLQNKRPQWFGYIRVLGIVPSTYVVVYTEEDQGKHRVR